MNFESHIDEAHKKVMGTLIYLNRLKDSFEPETHLIVVQSLALSLINYCFTVWETISKHTHEPHPKNFKTLLHELPLVMWESMNTYLLSYYKWGGWKLKISTAMMCAFLSLRLLEICFLNGYTILTLLMQGPRSPRGELKIWCEEG